MNKRTFLLALAGLPGMFLNTAANARIGSAAAPKYAPVLPARPLVFPFDYGAHPDYRTEWWYATGWLNLPDGSPLGFQSTFFRVRTGVGESNSSAFAPRQLILAHAALADPRLGRLRHEQRAARVGFGRAGFATGQTRVWVDDWRFEQSDGRYQATVAGEDFAYALSLSAVGPPVLNGDAGFSRKSPDPRHASYYYSRPQLRVSGTVTLDDRSQPVTGQAWLDHEWSSELLPETAQGWDWIGLNFDDGSALMAFRLRSKGGHPLWSGANFSQSAGRTKALLPDAVAFYPLRQWRSLRTGIIYPVEWRVRIATRDLHLQALIDDQELDSRRSTGAVYWEGAVRVTEDGREIGRGYLEMTGYGEKIRVG